MHITIIKDDQAVYQDGVVVDGINLSDLPDDFHALQWNGKVGHIEWKTITTPNQEVSTESEIDSALGVTLSVIKQRRTEKLKENQAKEPQAPTEE